jgi:hypothetical protein
MQARLALACRRSSRVSSAERLSGVQLPHVRFSNLMRGREVVTRQAHNLEVVGSNPTCATTFLCSSAVEHSPVKRAVLGSIPSAGASLWSICSWVGRLPVTQGNRVRVSDGPPIEQRPDSQVVRRWLANPSFGGSIPSRVYFAQRPDSSDGESVPLKTGRPVVRLHLWAPDKCVGGLTGKALACDAGRCEFNSRPTPQDF